jgi:uncharacterized membrane protein YeiB
MWPPPTGTSDHSLPSPLRDDATETVLRRPDRITGLDLARSFALLGMLFAHLDIGAAGTGWQNTVTRFANGRAMPLFVMLSGSGLAILLSRSNRPWREIAGRAAVLLLVGLALESTTPAAVILHFYAVYFLLGVVANRLPTRWLLPAAALVVALGAATSLHLKEHLPDSTQYRAGNADVIGALNLLWKPHVYLATVFFSGSYPVFPVFAFVLVGIWLARQDLWSRRLHIGLCVIGATVGFGFYGIGYATNRHRTGPVPAAAAEAPVEDAAPKNEVTIVEDDPRPSGWDLLNANGHSNMPAWMLGSTGAACFAIGLSLTVAERARRLVAPLVALGQLALTGYVGHLLLWRWPMRKWPWGFGPSEVLGYTVAGWLAAALFAWMWRRRFSHGPLEGVVRAAGRWTGQLGR